VSQSGTVLKSHDCAYGTLEASPKTVDTVLENSGFWCGYGADPKLKSVVPPTRWNNGPFTAHPDQHTCAGSRTHLPRRKSFCTLRLFAFILHEPLCLCWSLVCPAVNEVRNCRLN